MFRKLAGLTAIAGLFFAGSASAQLIGGTPHDMSGGAGAGEICIVCHAPHDTDAVITDAPLWNHLVTTQSFTPYGVGSSTIQATIGQPDGISKLCLSCHDGQTAVDAFGGVTTGIAMTGPRVVGTDLSNDHPVSFQYTSALATADGSLENPDALASNFDGSGTITATMLFGGNLECGTCHNAHDNSNGFFQRYDNANSVLCTTCHLK